MAGRAQNFKFFLIDSKEDHKRDGIFHVCNKCVAPHRLKSFIKCWRLQVRMLNFKSQRKVVQGIWKDQMMKHRALAIAGFTQWLSGIKKIRWPWSGGKPVSLQIIPGSSYDPPLSTQTTYGPRNAHKHMFSIWRKFSARVHLTVSNFTCYYYKLAITACVLSSRVIWFLNWECLAKKTGSYITSPFSKQFVTSFYATLILNSGTRSLHLNMYRWWWPLTNARLLLSRIDRLRANILRFREQEKYIPKKTLIFLRKGKTVNALCGRSKSRAHTTSSQKTVNHIAVNL